MEKATFGAGCFWCVEAVFQRLQGVEQVVSGYAGGKVKDPTYREVCYGKTGHAEVVQITYDPSVVSYRELVEVLFATHDPTTLNQQGNDVGTQYRSVIFYHNEEQKQIAEEVKRAVDASGAWKNPVVTEISPLPEFYVAEEYHQNYFNDNSNAPYCQYVVKPKVDKLIKSYREKLKEEAL
jgi:peptide-methionine (S)-S-oxide reductase